MGSFKSLLLLKAATLVVISGTHLDSLVLGRPLRVKLYSLSLDALIFNEEDLVVAANIILELLDGWLDLALVSVGLDSFDGVGGGLRARSGFEFLLVELNEITITVGI